MGKPPVRLNENITFRGKYIMEHSFNVNIAVTYGVNISIFLNNIAFWIQHNKANKKNFYKGRYWTFNSFEAFNELFPYWTYAQIRKIIKDCIDHDLLIKDNFNKNKYDKTGWYSLTEKGLQLFPHLICQKTHIDKSEKTDGSEKNDRPIPDNKPKIENANKTTTVSVVDNFIISKELDAEFLSLRNKFDPPEYNLLAEDQDDIDDRSDLEFLYQCKYHLDHCGNPKFNFIQQIAGLKKIIKSGFVEPEGYKSPIKEAKRKLKERNAQKAAEELSLQRFKETIDIKESANNAKNLSQLLKTLKKR